MRKLLKLIIVLFIVSCSKEGKVDSPIVAQVDVEILTISEAEQLKLALPNKNYNINSVVENWVDRELLYIAAIDGGLEHDKALGEQVDIYRKNLFGNTYMDNYIASTISIENADIKSYYDNNRGSFRHNNDGAKIMHFHTVYDSVAIYISEILKNPNYSVDKKSLLANFNVDVTKVERGNLVDQLDSEIFSNSRTGVVIGPVKTDYGYHVVEVLSRFKKDSQIDIDEAYDEIYQRLFNQQKALKSIKYLDSLRNHYTVKLNLENN